MKNTEIIDLLRSGELVITTAKELSKMVKERDKKLKRKWLYVEEVCDELEISDRQLYRNLKDSNCLLVITHKGERVKGRKTKYSLASVEQEKQRLKRI